EIEKLFKKTLENQKKYGFGACAVICKKTKKWLGFCGLWREFGDKLDFGYRFFKKFWGQGYATEAVSFCLDYLREKYPNENIYACISPKNLASVRVAEKSGMKFIKEDIYKGLKVLKYKI
ncbi:MAG: GNAT family N-acetyltransferase, partial [Candidatus Thorarchaeota archaeon]